MKSGLLNRIRNHRFLSPVLVVLLLPSLFNWQVVRANPVGEVLRHGAADFDRLTPGSLIVNQHDDKVIIDWQSFSIESGETTRFNQPSSSSAALNRVISAEPSKIFGNLSANGKLVLINQNGILIGASGRVDAAGFIASTLDISDSEFLAGGDMTFRGNSQAKVVNMGSISASEGDIFLIAKTVENHGLLNAPNGTVGLAAGQEVRILATGDERVQVKPGGQGTVINKGTIQAMTAELKAAGGNRMALAVNNEGTIRATGVSKRGGKVFLSAGTGRISNTGTVKARNSDGSGGAIKVEVTGEGDIENSGELDAGGEVGNGGVVELITANGNISSTGVIRASGEEDGGLVIFDAGGAGSAVNIDGVVDVTGVNGVGGRVQASGEAVNVGANALIDASGGSGGGQVFLGGGVAGQDSSVRNATNTTVAAGAQIRANAVNSGDAGTVVVWADGDTLFSGNISATAGGVTGDGGFAEVSGLGRLGFHGAVDLRSVGGVTGTLLLDPTNIEVVAGAAGSAGDDAELGDNVVNGGDGGAANFTISDGTLIASISPHLK